MPAAPRDPVPVGSRRRVILISRFGRSSGQKASIEPGTTLRIGRTERANLAFPYDGQVSALHCELRWDGETCRLKDLASITGTQLNGLRIEGEQQVGHGAWIQLGQTVVSVYFEAGTPPRCLSPRNPVEEAMAARALEAMAPLVGNLYAVVDAARDPVSSSLERSG